MTKPLLLLSAALLLSPPLQAQIIQRQLGEFDFKLGTSASRSMAYTDLPRLTCTRLSNGRFMRVFDR